MPVRLFPNGVPYPRYIRENIVLSSGQLLEVSKEWNVSRSTVYRIKLLMRLTDDVCGRKPYALTKKWSKCTLSAEDALNLSLFVIMCPQVTLFECKQFLLIGIQVEVSLSTVCRELKRLGITRKQLNRPSLRRREIDRVNWWINLPHLGGIGGVRAELLVDIDESSFNWGNSMRKYGYSFRGERAKAFGLVRILYSFSLKCFDFM